MWCFKKLERLFSALVQIFCVDLNRIPKELGSVHIPIVWIEITKYQATRCRYFSLGFIFFISFFFLFLLRSLSRSVLTVLSVSWFTHNVDLRSIYIRRLKVSFFFSSPFSVYFLFIFFFNFISNRLSHPRHQSKESKIRCFTIS